MLLIAVSYRRCGRNLRAKFYTAINSLSADHAYLKTLYWRAAAAAADLYNCQRRDDGDDENDASVQPAYERLLTTLHQHHYQISYISNSQRFFCKTRLNRLVKQRR